MLDAETGRSACLPAMIMSRRPKELHTIFGSCRHEELRRFLAERGVRRGRVHSGYTGPGPIPSRHSARTAVRQMVRATHGMQFRS